MSDWQDRADDEEYERAEAAAARKAAEGRLLVIEPNGSVRTVPCGYEGIRDGVGDNPFDFVAGATIGFYVDDEGLLTGAVLNVPVSIMLGRALYGPCVMCAAQPDAFGNTLAPPHEAVGSALGIAHAWRRVVASAAQIGQSTAITATSETVPPPQVISLDNEQFARWMETGEMPNG